MMFTHDRGQREADEFAERMQRELEASRSAESRDRGDFADAKPRFHLAVVDGHVSSSNITSVEHVSTSDHRIMTPAVLIDLDTGFHPKHTFGRRGNF